MLLACSSRYPSVALNMNQPTLETLCIRVSFPKFRLYVGIVYVPQKYIKESNNELYCQDKKARKMNYSTLCEENVKEPRRTIAYKKYIKELLVKFHNFTSMQKVIRSIKAEKSRNEPNKGNIGKSKYFRRKLNIPNSLPLDNRSIYIKYYPPKEIRNDFISKPKKSIANTQLN